MLSSAKLEDPGTQSEEQETAGTTPDVEKWLSCYTCRMVPRPPAGPTEECARCGCHFCPRCLIGQLCFMCHFSEKRKRSSQRRLSEKAPGRRSCRASRAVLWDCEAARGSSAVVGGGNTATMTCSEMLKHQNAAGDGKQSKTVKGKYKRRTNLRRPKDHARVGGEQDPTVAVKVPRCSQLFNRGTSVQPCPRQGPQVLRVTQIQPSHSAGTLRGTADPGIDTTTTPPLSDSTRGDHEVPWCSCVMPNTFVNSEKGEKMSLRVRCVLPRRRCVLPRSMLCIRDARKSNVWDYISCTSPSDFGAGNARSDGPFGHRLAAGSVGESKKLLPGE